MLNKVLKRNIITAYLISVPIGLFTILSVYAVPVIITNEGLPTMLLVFTYGWASLGLFLSFLISIWYGSKKAHQSLLKGKKILLASFKFSSIINTIIWLTFIVILMVNTLFMNHKLSLIRDSAPDDSLFNLVYLIILPLVAFVMSVLGTTFTIGLLISYLFNRNIKKNKTILELNEP